MNLMNFRLVVGSTCAKCDYHLITCCLLNELQTESIQCSLFWWYGSRLQHTENISGGGGGGGGGGRRVIFFLNHWLQ